MQTQSRDAKSCVSTFYPSPIKSAGGGWLIKAYNFIVNCQLSIVNYFDGGLYLSFPSVNHSKEKLIKEILSLVLS